jgi:hypothetical protein
MVSAWPTDCAVSPSHVSFAPIQEIKGGPRNSQAAVHSFASVYANRAILLSEIVVS